MTSSTTVAVVTGCICGIVIMVVLVGILGCLYYKRKTSSNDNSNSPGGFSSSVGVMGPSRTTHLYPIVVSVEVDGEHVYTTDPCIERTENML